MHKINELFQKYINGTIKADELEFFLRRIRRFNNNELAEELNVTIDCHELSPEKIQSIYHSFLQKCDVSKLKKISKNRNFAWAAVIVVLISVGMFIFKNYYKTIVVKTGFGEKTTWVLPDNSVVHLNANSKLYYSRDWNADPDRIIKLKGEAFFEVEKDTISDRKFVVKTDDLSIAVLGTQFNVNTRQNSTKIYLKEGSVHVLKASQDLSEVMLPGEEIVYSEKGLKKYRPLPETQPTSWKDGTKVFYDMKLQDILIEMENIYGKKLILENEALMQNRYTISLPLTDFEIAKTLLLKLTDTNIIL